MVLGSAVMTCVHTPPVDLCTQCTCLLSRVRGKPYMYFYATMVRRRICVLSVGGRAPDEAPKLVPARSCQCHSEEAPDLTMTWP